MPPSTAPGSGPQADRLPFHIIHITITTTKIETLMTTVYWTEFHIKNMQHNIRNL